MRARTLSALFAFSLVSLGTSSAFAATYQVGPSRTIKTLAAVAPMLAPGDLVEVDGDATYGSVIFQKPGTAANKITIRGMAVNGKRPVVSGGSNTIEAQADHYVFEGLELTGGSFRCFYHHADDITLRGSVIHDCPAHGLLGADSDSGSLTMEYVEVYKCGNGTRSTRSTWRRTRPRTPGPSFECSTATFTTAMVATTSSRAPSATRSITTGSRGRSTTSSS